MRECFLSRKKLAANNAKALGTQEAQSILTIYVDNLSDEIVMGNKSQMHRYINELMANDPSLSKEEAYRKAILEFYVNRPLTAAKDAAIQTAIFGGVTSIANGIKNHTSSKSVSSAPETISEAQLSADKHQQDTSTEPNLPPIDNNGGTKVLHQDAESKSKGTDVVELMLRKSSNLSDGENVARADMSSSQTSNPFVSVAKQSAADAKTGAFFRNLWCKDYNAKVNELIANGQESAKSVVNWSYANEAAKIISTGKDLTDIQLGRLYRNNGQKETKTESLIRSDLDNPLLKALKERETTNPLTEKTAPLAEKTDVLEVDGVKSGEYTEIGKSGTEGAAITGKIITEIKYKPSSGVILKVDPNKTTTVLGSFDRDMKHILNETGDFKSTYFGAKKGGFNILNVPDDMYKTRTRIQFWDDINKPWLDEAISRGDDIVLATKPEGKVMQSFNKLTGEWGPSGFAREYQYLIERGYHFDSTTNMMVR